MSHATPRLQIPEPLIPDLDGPDHLPAWREPVNLPSPLDWPTEPIMPAIYPTEPWPVPPTPPPRE